MSSTDAPTDEAEATPRDDTARNELVARLTAHLGEGLLESHIEPGVDVWLRVSRESWREAAAFAKDGLGFAYFNFLSGIDWMPSPFGREMDSQIDTILAASADHDDVSAPANADDGLEQGLAGGETRFQVFARLNDVVNGLGITLKVDLPDDDLSVDSWVPVYPGANWHEREAKEMYGFSFNGHPGLRPLYLPSEFEGHPLRKDYPLLARRMKPWPGIVDVEQMPGDDEEEDGGEA